MHLTGCSEGSCEPHTCSLWTVERTLRPPGRTPPPPTHPCTHAARLPARRSAQSADSLGSLRLTACLPHLSYSDDRAPVCLPSWTVCWLCGRWLPYQYPAELSVQADEPVRRALKINTLVPPAEWMINNKPVNTQIHKEINQLAEERRWKNCR